MDPRNRSEAAAEERCRKRIRKEVTCSICLSYFSNPMELGCKHNFCETCILRSWKESGENTRCPECRTSVGKDLKQNRLLRNLVEIISEWDHSAEREAQRRRSECQRHQKTLDLFCQDEEVSFCSECDTFQEHGSHKVVPVAEAAQDYKDQLCRGLESLKEQMAKIKDHKTSSRNESEGLLKKLTSNRRKVKGKFRELRLFLEKLENQQLKQMEEVETEIRRRTSEHQARLSGEFDTLQNISRELEEKLLQPPSEFLQDIRSMLQRHEDRPVFEPPAVFPPKLLCKAWDFGDINLYLEAVIEQFKATVTPGISLQIAKVTLDPDTAHPHLILSEDRRRARWGETLQELPDNPERFDTRTFVLGREEFTAGRHIWEVSLGCEDIWAVGVAKKSVQRKGIFYFTPKDSIWGMSQLESKPRPAHHTPLAKRKRIWVAVNYAGGRITFLDAETGYLFCSFRKATFSGEPLLPIFCVGPKTFLDLPLVTN